MGILNRAFLNIKRKRGRSLIFFLAITLLGGLGFVSVLLESTASQTIDNLRRSMPAVVTVERENDTYIIQEPSDIEQITFEHLSLEQIENIAALPYVRDYEFIDEIGVVSYGWNSYGTIFSNQNLSPEDSTITRMLGVNRPGVSLIESGLLNLVSGRTFYESEMTPISINEVVPILISYPVADLNNVTIGDKIEKNVTLFNLPQITDLDYFKENIYAIYERYGMDFYRESFPFVVVGLFDFPLESYMNENDRLNRYTMLNSAIAPFWRTNEMWRLGHENSIASAELFHDLWIELGRFSLSPEQRRQSVSYGNPFFRLYDINDFDYFSEAISDYIPENWRTVNLFSSLPFIYESISNTRVLARYSLLLIISGSVVSLSLLIILLVKDRKKEVAIYIGLGEKKSNIVFQILSELLVLSILGLAVAVPVASTASLPLTRVLIRNELMQSEEQWISFIPEGRTILTEFGFGRSISPEEAIEFININLGIEVILMFLFGGILVTIVSTIIPSMYLFEQKPKELLADSTLG